MAASKRLSPLTLVVILLAVYYVQALTNSRIWSGSDASSGQYPHVASIRIDNAHTCVGSIISTDYILTAANCVSQMGDISIDASRVTVRVGSINQYAAGQIISVSSILIHPSYDTTLHDIALLQLSQSLVYTEKIQQIDLANEEDEYDEGTSVIVTGWGLQESGSAPFKLQQLTLPVLGQEECKAQAGYGYDSVICLEHFRDIGICRGDYGTGVVAGTKLIGVASFAFGGCGTIYPDITSKVSYYRSWIDSIIIRRLRYGEYILKIKT